MGNFRRSSSRKTGGALSEINVTPLVDVLLVLLIIFMVTAPQLHHGISVPTPSNAPQDNKKPPPDTKEKPTLFVDRKRQFSYKKQKIVDLEKLAKVLKKDAAIQKSKELYLQADPDLPYGQVMEVIGVMRKSGVKSIGMVVEPSDLN